MEKPLSRLRYFAFEGIKYRVAYEETTEVTDGVTCSVYRFLDDESKDLGVIHIKPGSNTPKQRVLQGDRTVEGHIQGNGRLIIIRSDGTEEIHKFTASSDEGFETTVNLGDIMQWQADANSDLVAYEICIPPYQAGRFENLE